MDEQCNCPECQLERAGIEVTPEVVSELGLGCYYCSMTGYETYPSRDVPCRLGHTNPEDEWAERMMNAPSSSMLDFSFWDLEAK